MQVSEFKVSSKTYCAQLYVMVVCNHQYNAANLNQSKSQLELSLAQFSPSLFL